MPPSVAKSFRAVLEPDHTRLRWTIARIPFDITRAWPVRRGLRVRGEINGFPFRTALFPDPQGEGKVLLVNKRMQAGAKARIGAEVQIRIEPDLEERAALMPPELAAALRQDRRLRRWFDGLGEYTRRTIGAMVSEAKSPEARENIAARVVERMLLTLEGELDPPPILKAAFQRQPLARTGWEAMTPAQRRTHLFGIFYYQTAEGRERRAGQAIDDALRRARKKAATK
jgi:uncharacterized protein YdeI (YjbR/CyaY-like superfamily)